MRVGVLQTPIMHVPNHCSKKVCARSSIISWVATKHRQGHILVVVVVRLYKHSRQHVFWYARNSDNKQQLMCVTKNEFL